MNTGVHSQLVVANVLDNACLLQDSTYGYALRIPFVTVTENDATMMETPIAQDNLLVLDSARTAATPQMLQTVISGASRPTYIYRDALYGSESWGARISWDFYSLGG